MIQRTLESLVEDPPKEDSADLTDEEIAQAIVTTSHKELAQHLIEELRRRDGLVVKSHELRRRGENLFWRTHLVFTPDEPDRVLLFRVDWLGG